MPRVSHELIRGIRSSLILFLIFFFLYLPVSIDIDSPLYRYLPVAIDKPNFLGSLDDLWSNFLIREYSKQVERDERIVLLLVDNKTKKALKITGPLRPSFYGKLLQKVKEDGAKVVAFDLYFANYGEDLDQKRFTEESVKNRVLHVVFSDSENNVNYSMENPRYPFLGNINLKSEKIKRSVRAYLKKGEEHYYFLPLEAVSQYRESAIQLRKGREITIGRTRVPLDSHDSFLIKYYQNKPNQIFEEIKVENFLEGRVRREALRDKIVVVGSSAIATQDSHFTPFGKYLGTEIIAIVTKNLLDNDFLYRVELPALCLYTLFLLLLQGVILSRRKPGEAFWVTAIFVSSTLFLSYFFFAKSYSLEISFPLVALIANYGYINLYKVREVEDLLNLNKALMDEISRRGLDGKNPQKEWLEFVLKLICGSIRGEKGGIFFLDRGQLSLYCGYNLGDLSSSPALESMVRDDALYPKEGYLVLDLKKRNPALSRQLELDSLSLFSLVGKEKKIGMLMIGKRSPEYFTKDQLREILMAAIVVGIFIENTSLLERTKKSYLESIFALAKALDARDSYTHGHSQRVSEFGGEIARRMGLREEEIVAVKNAGILHDIGKIGIPGHVLRKEGALTEEEYDIIKQHPGIGAEILSPIEEMKGIVPLVLHHHEKYTGGGYPLGLKGEEIPVGARILAVADTYDAMASDRPYRKGMSREKALEQLAKLAGSQLDPRIVEIFLSL